MPIKHLTQNCEGVFTKVFFLCYFTSFRTLLGFADYLTTSSSISSILTIMLLHYRTLWLEMGYLICTKGSLFFTSRTIFTDSSSKSSSKLSGRGGRTGSKFFCATVSCTTSIACIKEIRNSNVWGNISLQFLSFQHYIKLKPPASHPHHKSPQEDLAIILPIM